MPPEASLVSPHGRSLLVCPRLYTDRRTGAPRRPQRGSSGSRLDFSQRGQNLHGVVLRLHLRPDPRNSTVGAHEEARPDDAPVGLAVVGLLGPGAVQVGDGVVFIRQEREGQSVLGAKRSFAGGTLRAQPPNLGVGGLECGVVVSE